MNIEEKYSKQDIPNKGSLTNYKKRTIKVAYDLTKLTNNLYFLLRKEISIKES